jgi:signal transduction histidine kinase
MRAEHPPLASREWLATMRARLTRPSSRRKEAGAAMFIAIRRRLTLWYTATLATLLLLSGLLLYFGMNQAVLGPVDDALHISAAHLSNEWLNSPAVGPGATCPQLLDHVRREPPDTNYAANYTACYDANGTFQALTAQATTGQVLLLPAPTDPLQLQLLQQFQPFTAPSLVQSALTSTNGTASDTMDSGNILGAVRRFAIVVRDGNSGTVLGVVQVGIPVEGQVQALHTLAVLLLVFGGLTIVGSAIAGRLLAGRALEPANLAFARQQTFVADAAHELRTPLTLLRADAEVLLRSRERLAPEDAELLDDIVTETSHMATLASNMLSLARLDARAMPLEREVVDLAHIAQGVVERTRTLAAQHGLSLHAQDIHEALVIGDRALLEQAALILVENAIKYNQPHGSIVLRTRLNGRQALLEVADTGIGISAEHLARLGERFYRVDKARSREAGGAGLGLSIARGIAQTLGGELTLTSVPGKGTTATLALPAAAR